MNASKELRLLSDKMAATGQTLTAEKIVDEAKDAKKYPGLHKQLWSPSEKELAMEARLARAHRMMISLRVVVGETGAVTRMMVHTPGTKGYQSLEQVALNPDLCIVKLTQLADDVKRARGRLAAFRAALPEEIVGEIDDILAQAEERLQTAVKRRATHPAA